MSISKVGTYAFYNHPNLERATISAQNIEAYAFQFAKKLDRVDLTSENSVIIYRSAFENCKKLTHLAIRCKTRATLALRNALDGTQIANGEGGIYVPADLLDSYKSATNWSAFAKNIYPIEKYPLSVFDSIQDDWSTIFANSSYATDYSVRDTKTLELTDGTKIKMDLAALNTDVKSDNSGTAKMTWICHGILMDKHMNATAVTTDGWAGSELRSYLISDILSKIPTEIKSHIVPVKKSYRSKSPNDETLWSDDEIWIPSYKEVGFNKTDYIESDGVTYPDLFTSGTTSAANGTRIKYYSSGTAGVWWLRSAGSTTTFRCVHSNGSEAYGSATNAYGIVFGFCTD